MSGFGGRVIITGSPNDALVGTSYKLAARQLALLKTSGATCLTKTYDLGGGAYVTIADVDHMRAMHIVAPSGQGSEQVSAERSEEAYATVGVTDVVSGLVVAPYIDTILIDGYLKKDGAFTTTTKVPADAVRAFVATHRTAARYNNTDCRRRLAIDENPIFAPLENPLDLRFSEHAHVKPTHYSGAMRRVAQLLLGLGKILRPTAEEKWMSDFGEPPLTLSSVPSTFGLYDYPPYLTARLNFDYRAAKTHGVSFGSDGKPWVIEISTRGVHAMPLYMDAVSTTALGQARYRAVSPELDEFLDEFGGIPLGITVPVLEDFDRYKRAGEVVELLSATEMRTFYNKVLYSSEHGWCFNNRGTEAHNTCWEWALSGHKRGYHYSVQLSVGKETFAAWTPARARLAGMMTKAYERNKCRRMTEDQAKALLYTYANDAEAGYKAFDELVVTPTLAASASLRLQKFGYLYSAAMFKAQPQIKFPEPLLGGLISFDFSPADRYTTPAVKCDTPMFVCFIQDALEVVNYALPLDSTFTPESYDTRQECQFVGGWQSYTAHTKGRLCGNFYSNRWDWRSESVESDTLTVSTGQKLLARPHFGQLFFFSTAVWVGTTVWFRINTKSTTTSGRGMDLSVAIPMNDRCCYYMGKKEEHTGTSTFESENNTSVEGPHGEYWELYNFHFYWVGGGIPCENPRPTSCVAVKQCDVEMESCVDDNLADGFFLICCTENGRTISASPAGSGSIGGVGATYWPSAPHLPSPYSKTSSTPRWGACEIRLINDTKLGDIVAKYESKTGDEADTSMSAWWFKASPDEDGAIPTLGATSSCLGADVTNYMDDFNGNDKSAGGPEYLRGSWTGCYTGVIE